MDEPINEDQVVDLQFQGTHAVVTGASSGIGRSIAIDLSRRGVKRIVIHYRHNVAGAQQTAESCRELGTEPILLSADLADLEAAESFADRCYHDLGAIHSWINNAGADVLTGELSELDFSAKLQHLMQVDVIGTIYLARQVAERMTQQTFAKPPSMTFIGWDQSASGMEGDAGQMFGSVKAAVTAFALSLAQTLAPQVRVNVVAPGWIQTSWGQAASAYWDGRARNQSLMNRWGTPEDVARAIAFVSDPENSFFSGQVVQVNGGWNRNYIHR
ncbi:3-oxoacyl-(acyl-carrier protein) reductase [Rhodopirellula maiorica SM1]|uniref:3-oxoacyl-(Acyl-carrier protein) reductase n=1 Tax=Rhodopirellula maiorica SM1 TaxID=1265738 RepID=M5RGJ4_9BACT|nr:SDR family oxidoreductase [Rhodopirellula maiorica]EMI18513.1 3-oxoacyl-(acyl-carrier protein) reductase [Rhodopirellula maiorica SM1]